MPSARWSGDPHGHQPALEPWRSQVAHAFSLELQRTPRRSDLPQPAHLLPSVRPARRLLALAADALLQRAHLATGALDLCARSSMAPQPGVTHGVGASSL